MIEEYLNEGFLRRLGDQINSFLSDRRQPVLMCFNICIGVVLFCSALCIYWLNDQLKVVDQKLHSHGWTIPSTVYAMGPELHPGLIADQEWLVRHLERLEYQQVQSGILKPAQYASESNQIIFRDQPDDPAHAGSLISVNFKNNRILRLNDLETGKEIPTYRLEPEELKQIFGARQEKRTLIAFEDLPPHLIHALIAVEDRRFYTHHGIDPLAIARAVYENLTGNGPLQGGSTITQQLVKNLCLTRQRSFHRKIREAAMALFLERKLKKNEILEMYLNEIYLGQSGPVGILGVGEASKFYFGKDVSLISVPESALLVGMIQGPQKYNPYSNPDRAKMRRDQVLRAMYNAGSITQIQLARYIETPVLVHSPERQQIIAPYFVDSVLRQLHSMYTPDQLHRQNLRIYSTLDIDMQEIAESALVKGLRSIDRIRLGKTKKHVQGCLIALEPSTGYVRAYVGGRSFSSSQYDRVMQAHRQPGSAFKPVVYAAALESPPLGTLHGSITPATLLADQPWTMQDKGKTWAPQNYDGTFHGIVSARTALAKSMNLATVQLSQEVGLGRIAKLSQTLGFQNVKPYPSLALGAFEVTPWQLAEGYTAFANLGSKSSLISFTSVANEDGNPLWQRPVHRQRAINPQVAYLLVDMMKSVVNSGTASYVRRAGLKLPVAGKTGTTDDFRDAWFVGFTPDLLCLVWIGYDDNTPLQMNAAQTAVPVWTDFMKKATLDMPVRDFPRPSGIVSRLIDPFTGKLAGDSCYNVVQELFIAGTEPTERCNDYYHMIPEQDLIFSPVLNERYRDEEYPERQSDEKSGFQQSQQFIYFAPEPKSDDHESDFDEEQ